jgi:hypothetical protein
MNGYASLTTTCSDPPLIFIFLQHYKLQAILSHFLGRNVYVCPRGTLLHTTGRIHDEATVLYRARTYDCGPCLQKPTCCTKAPERKIPRSIYEDARDTARSLVNTETSAQSCHDRKRVEMLFAHLKRILKLGRLRLRGSRGAQDEFTLAAHAQNLRRLPSWLFDRHQRPSPMRRKPKGSDAIASKPPLPNGVGWQQTASKTRGKCLAF